MIHKALYPSDDIDKLHVSRKEGRGLATIEDCVDASMQQQEDFMKKARWKTDCSHQKQFRQWKQRQYENNQKTKIVRETNVWKSRAINKQNLTRQNLDIAKKWKP